MVFTPGGPTCRVRGSTSSADPIADPWEVATRGTSRTHSHDFEAHTPGCAASHTWEESWERPASTPKHHRRRITERHPLHTPEAAGRSPVEGLLWCVQDTRRDVLGKVTEANLYPRPMEVTAPCKQHDHLTDDKLEPQRGQVCTFRASLAGENCEIDGGW